MAQRNYDTAIIEAEATRALRRGDEAEATRALRRGTEGITPAWRRELTSVVGIAG